ncbi:MAG: hypothetical protein HY762_04090 [Planctomycetes bacterium]|nr:hypothetical protein [Planctomycetota bacterium]
MLYDILSLTGLTVVRNKSPQGCGLTKEKKAELITGEVKRSPDNHRGDKEFKTVEGQIKINWI